MIVGTKRVDYHGNESARIVQVIYNVDFRQQHDGLRKVAMAAGVTLKKLTDGAIICFINTQRNKIKFLAPNGTLAYYKSPSGRVDLAALNFVNHAFLIRGDVDYDIALRKSLEERLGIDRKRDKENARKWTETRATL